MIKSIKLQFRIEKGCKENYENRKKEVFLFLENIVYDMFIQVNSDLLPKQKNYAEI